jgi:C-terminal processing protease CtpA/Prc
MPFTSELPNGWTYLRHKTGSGHDDFSDPLAIYLDPDNGVRWQKKVIVLTNRHCFSATNDFVNTMRCLPGVTILGDRTGGGSGMPFTSELPNGWTVRYSASPYFDAQMNQIEFGIDPDVQVSLSSDDVTRGVDTLIETARKLLAQ